MDVNLTMVLGFFETTGYFAPILFLMFHIVRQALFIPVAVVNMAGGVLFGSAFGTLFSILGMFIASLIFYFVAEKMPKQMEKLLRLKAKVLGRHARLTMGQITILRLIPFMHVQLLNLCMMERARGFGKYAKYSLITNLPLAFFYTVFGEFLSQFTPTMILTVLLSCCVLFYILREKWVVVKWQEFFEKNEKDASA